MNKIFVHSLSKKKYLEEFITLAIRTKITGSYFLFIIEPKNVPNSTQTLFTSKYCIPIICFAADIL